MLLVETSSDLVKSTPE